MWLTKFLLVLILHSGYAQRSCFKSYYSTEIIGNDLTSVAGTSSSCCQACQNNAQCKAYSWTNANGGTCYLKSDPQPLVPSNQTSSLTVVMSPTANETYSLLLNYKAPDFFNHFWFDDRAPHTFGFAKFVGDNDTAWQNGLFNYTNNKVYMGVDHTTDIDNKTWGRLAFRINSYEIYNAGLFILNMDHIPVGPYNNGTGWQDSPVWPSWWFTGDNANGEFDVFEAYPPADVAMVTIHDWQPNLYGNCTLPKNITSYYNGSDAFFYNDGTMSQLTPHGTYGVPFNAAGGGVYAFQWDHGRFLRVWTWQKQDVPADIVNESPNPNPDTWGLPHAYFPFGHNDWVNCSGEVLNHVYISFDISFCNPPIESYCEDIVRHQPQSFEPTYFLINYMKVFCRPNEACLTDIYGSGKK